MGKEPSAAFMRTSNDSLHSFINGINHSGSHDSPTASTSRSDTAVLSPLSQPNPLEIPPLGHDQTMSTLPGGLPERQSIGSASQLPQAQFPPPSRYSDATWKELYYNLLAVHDAEREAWNAERRQLLADHQRLLEQTGSFSTEHNKVYPDSATVKHANESLRRLSQVSSRSDRGSVSEDETSTNTVRRVSIAANPKVVYGTPPLQMIPEDDPYSPQTTAQIMSPVPHQNTIFAGHTPMKPRSPPVEGDAENIPVFKPNKGQNDGLDEDRELSSPKMLPSLPSSGNVDGLDDLNLKLQAVAENPDAHPPEALTAPGGAGNTTNVDDTDAQDGSDSISPRNLNNLNKAVDKPVMGNGPPGAIHDADVGVKLKKKRSSNFGAPFGKLS